jgi:hypothetical protein
MVFCRIPLISALFSSHLGEHGHLSEPKGAVIKTSASPRILALSGPSFGLASTLANDNALHIQLAPGATLSARSKVAFPPYHWPAYADIRPSGAQAWQAMASPEW